MAQVRSQWHKQSRKFWLVALLSWLVLTSVGLAGALGAKKEQFTGDEAQKQKQTGQKQRPAKHPSNQNSSRESQATATQQPKPQRLIANSNAGFLTCLSSDKQIYRIGETVYIRGVLLRASDHTPINAQPPSGSSGLVKIIGPRGENLGQTATSIAGSIWTHTWVVPQSASGGEYSIEITYPTLGYPPATRKFEVRAYRAPRLNSQITFLRDGYGPGDKVTATLEVQRAEGGIPKDAKVTVKGIVDGNEITGETASIASNGTCKVSLDLPKEIERGDGTLSLTIADGGVVESASKTIPILVQFVDIQMYPEGGDLVAGLLNRVYLQALQTNGKPADLEGVILAEAYQELAGCNFGNQSYDAPQAAAPKKDEADKNSNSEARIIEVATFRTEHEGRGRFEFVPECNTKYFLKINKPTGFQKRYELPQVKSTGAVLRAEKDTYKRNEAIVVNVGSTEGAVRVTLSKKERELISTSLYLPRVPAPGKNAITLQQVMLPAGSGADGVLTVTVYDKNGRPLAERLVLKEPSSKVNLQIKPDKEKYAPGDHAKITIKATDDKGEPIAARLGLKVTDESTIQLTEKREQLPSLPVMFFLEPEVKDLADAHIYFDANNPRAPLATDLLLGTQGWRRFALFDLNKFLSQYGDKARQALNIELVQDPHSRIIAGRIGEQGGGFDVLYGQPIPFNRLIINGKDKTEVRHSQGYTTVSPWAFVQKRTPYGLPADIGRAEGPRDMNMFQVEPSVLDERYYTSGRSERHQKTSPTLPEGAPIPDADGITSVDRYPFFGGGYAPVYLRQYAHKVDKTAKDRTADKVRKDFVDTLFWNADIQTNPDTGEATAEFDLNDSVTSFRVEADAFTVNGALGANHKAIESVRPIYAEIKLPLEVTRGDKLLLPLNLVNGSGGAIRALKVDAALPKGFKLLAPIEMPHSMQAGERLRVVMPILVMADDGNKTISVAIDADNFHDNVSRVLKVKSTGYPKEETASGLIEPGKTVKCKLSIDKDMVPFSMATNSQIYPGPVGKLTSALERLIHQPCGCFEQVSSTSYPLTMAQQYFLTHRDGSIDLSERAKVHLADAYKKLVAYRCPSGGFDWYGRDPGNVALTAYGIMQFTDMARVQIVDAAMIAETRQWILKHKDGKGGFTSETHGGWSADKEASDAYIVWALLESGQPETDLKEELASLAKHAECSQNTYVAALAANAFALTKDKDLAKNLRKRLVALQTEDGSVQGATATILGTYDCNMQNQATALAALAWMRDPEYSVNVEKCIKYLAESCKNGAFGSTQSTVLALKAILAYDNLSTAEQQDGRARLIFDGKPVGDWRDFKKDCSGAVKLPSLEELLTPGEHTVEISLEGGKKMPYSLAANYNTALPESAKDCKILLEVKLVNGNLTEGQASEVLVSVANLTKEPAPMPIAIINLPGGLEPRHDQLKELVKRGIIAHYEVEGQQVVLYWRSLAANEKVIVPLSVVATVPGTYTGGASQAYLYYADNAKKWVAGLKVSVKENRP